MSAFGGKADIDWTRFLFDLFGASGVTGLNIYSMIRRHRWIDRCAADLQRADRAPARLIFQ
jgi:hypothetical protein